MVYIVWMISIASTKTGGGRLQWRGRSDQVAETSRVYIATRNHDPDFLTLQIELLAKRQRERQTAGRLHHRLHAVEQETHRLDQFTIADGQDIVHLPLYHREGQVAEVLGLGAVGNRPRDIDMHDAPAADRKSTRL